MQVEKIGEAEGFFDRIVNFFVENQDERTQDWFLSGSMTPLIMILVSYLYFCLYAGPRYMAKRKPFQLEKVLIGYNAIQVVLSMVLVWEGIQGGWNGTYNFKCQPVDYTRSPTGMRMAGAVWLYYICKVVELLDTVFFVLRKRQRQVSFLHLYHHTLMPVCGFIGVKYFAGGHGSLLGLINSFIHVCMYAYYMLAAMGPKVQKYLWWKRYLTVMQIIQFIIVFYHTAQVQFQPSCAYPKSIAALLTLNAGIFIYMFSSFYVKSYTQKSQQKASTAEVNNNRVGCSPKEVLLEDDSRLQQRLATVEQKKDL
ncbi:elongation of very long chain fatty acids protein 7 [Toxorhynchites rutilus septentrionalis]|uniref:elongation of very long chain fatty acids protein 7 n=1 Tax=Toxorhynchites rutilus septentrionalis TaxID=329112 RepID=UPI002478D947|nr:elongation of very long chain fatty acids protein 7 [Toxorhynchites rutilus septentrionalis]XP_055631369.1 elongation of very long chain fatty acids protein 7 [Toxorhynchites rutilus septentrionalis]XP_055631370.1 elongation of very long chain fatty acids protein 7 [Toxorhynchites rutilus septentrionalis]XP_055631371.1 elongation of very long chain fatty acids protein 7 [Toxorhynchites rutilus septentrionalis]XP_055631373.1 elongation of very long chain fatty acids protein 7 [Toxorhynchites 